MKESVELFPIGGNKNLGDGSMKGWKVPKTLADKFLKTKMWSTVPVPTTKEDLTVLFNDGKVELLERERELNAERERLIREREEIEALRAELLTGKKPKKSEV